MKIPRLLIAFTVIVLCISQSLDAMENRLSMSPAPLEEDFAKAWWLKRHAEKLKEIEARSADIDVVFLGDSITHAWDDKGLNIWQRDFVPRGGLNLGFAGDRTENVLLRIEKGQIDNMSPSVFVILIGTNNTGHRRDPAEHTAAGISQIIHEVHARHPMAQIILHAVFPRGRKPNGPLRRLNEDINALISPLAELNYVHWLDLSHMFVDEQGIIPMSIMEDALHPNSNQYPLWATELLPIIDNLRGK